MTSDRFKMVSGRPFYLDKKAYKNLKNVPHRFAQVNTGLLNLWVCALPDLKPKVERNLF